MSLYDLRWYLIQNYSNSSLRESLNKTAKRQSDGLEYLLQKIVYLPSTQNSEQMFPEIYDAIHQSVVENKSKSFEILLDWCDKINADKKYIQLYKLVYEKIGLQVVAEHLLDSVWDKNLPPLMNILDKATDEDYALSLVKLMIENGVNPHTTLEYHFKFSMIDNSENNNTISSVFLAAFRGLPKILDYLVNVTNKEKFTEARALSPLLGAIYGYNPVCLEILLNSVYLPRTEFDACPNFRVFHHVSGRTFYTWKFLDYMFELKDLKCVKEVSMVLKLLLGMESFVFTPEFIKKSEIFQMIDSFSCCISDILTVLLEHGGLETILGTDNFYAVFIDSIQNTFSLVENSIIDKIKRKKNFINNISALLDYYSVFKINDANGIENISLDATVPSLKQICRTHIRCALIRRHSIVSSVEQLHLPQLLKGYVLERASF